MLIKKLFKWTIRVIAMPAALALFLIQVVCGILIGLSSLVTNIAAGLFLFGSAAGWMAGAKPEQIWQCVGLGLFFLASPHIANGVVGIVTDLLYRVLGIISG